MVFLLLHCDIWCHQGISTELFNFHEAKIHFFYHYNIYLCNQVFISIKKWAALCPVVGRGRSHSWDLTWSLWKGLCTAMPCRKSNLPETATFRLVTRTHTVCYINCIMVHHITTCQIMVQSVIWYCYVIYIALSHHIKSCYTILCWVTVLCNAHFCYVSLCRAIFQFVTVTQKISLMIDLVLGNTYMLAYWRELNTPCAAN